MERIVSFEVDRGQFVFADVIADYPDVRMRFDRTVPSGARPLEYLWGAGVSAETFGDAVRSCPATDGVDVLGDAGDWTLCRLDWGPTERLPALYESVVETDAVIRSLRTVDDGWHFSLQFRSTAAVSAFQDRCLGNGVPLQVTEISEPPATYETVLTDRQREILALALDRGYYEVPRQITLEDLADELDVGLAAVSEGLRRAEERVVRSHFYPQTPRQRARNATDG